MKWEGEEVEHLTSLVLPIVLFAGIDLIMHSFVESGVGSQLM